jgi:Tol biopolymer transport system component/predicted Ser/Thr protein kinase
MVGKTISHYKVLEKLGEGGMGEVYKARDTHLDRLVAIKILPTDRNTDAQRRLRFVQEAKAASALNHPNIITVHDAGEADGSVFIAMEYVSGKPLTDLISRKGMGLNEALRYAVQMADALTAAHEAGIIHRDVKPGNVMVTDKGLVKVLDFGLAKLAEQAPPGPDESTRTLKPATEEGTIVGTVAYMSPEQAEGKRLDARSDIFSFGSVLYEMITGRRAFQGDSKMSTLASIITQEPGPLPPVVPHDLEKIIGRCLRKDPARRFQTMADLKVTLEELKEDSESGKLAAAGAAPARKRRRWLLVAAAAIPLLAVTGWLVWRNIQGASLPPPRVVPLTTYVGSEAGASFSPDGKYVAFHWDGETQDNTDIYIKRIDSGDQRRLTTDPARDVSPEWSPDDRYIAFARLQGNLPAIYLTSPLGGQERKLMDICAPIDYRTSWSPDGKWLAVTECGPGDTNQISLIPVERGEKRSLVSSVRAKVRYGYPAFSPDGRFLAYYSDDGAISGHIYLLELGPDFTPKGQPRRLTADARTYNRIAWEPDGRFVVYGGAGHLYRQPVSNAAQPQRLELAGAQASGPAISRVGSRLAYTRNLSVTGRDVWKFEVGAPAKIFISSTASDADPQFSPDGKMIAFISDRSGTWDIWIANQDGTNPLQLTHGEDMPRGSPRWSPDGHRIAFDGATKDGRRDIFVIEAEGGNERRLTSYPTDENVPNWSRDGKRVYFGSKRTGRFEVWRVPAAGGEAVQVTRDGGYAPAESWDGKTLYYTKWGIPGLFASPVGGGPERRVLERLANWFFFPVKDGVYYLNYLARAAEGRPNVLVLEVQFLDVATERSRVVGQFKTTWIGGFGVSPDQKTFLYGGIAPESTGTDLMLIENFR